MRAVRQLVLLTIVVGALVAILWARPAPAPAAICRRCPTSRPRINSASSAIAIPPARSRRMGSVSPTPKAASFASSRSAAARRSRCRRAKGRSAISTWTSNDTVVAEDSRRGAMVDYRVGCQRWPIGAAGLRWPTRQLSSARRQCAALATKAGLSLRSATSTSRVAAASFPLHRGESRAIVARCVLRRATAWSALSESGRSLRATRTCVAAIAASSNFSPTIAVCAVRVRAPSMAPSSSRSQSYRTFSPMSPATAAPTRQLTTFQSETPSYHPTRPLIAFTYGTWRRVVDDAKYPDIAQEIGVDRRDAAAAGREAARGDRAIATPKIRRWRGRRTASGSPFTRIARCRTMCGCGRRTASSPTSASRSSAAAPKWAGRAGRRMARRCCSTARARATADR